MHITGQPSTGRHLSPVRAASTQIQPTLHMLKLDPSTLFDTCSGVHVSVRVWSLRSNQSSVHATHEVTRCLSCLHIHAGVKAEVDPVHRSLLVYFTSSLACQSKRPSVGLLRQYVGHDRYASPTSLVTLSSVTATQMAGQLCALICASQCVLLCVCVCLSSFHS